MPLIRFRIDSGARAVSFFNNSLNGPNSNNRSVKEEKSNSEQNRAQSPNQVNFLWEIKYK